MVKQANEIFYDAVDSGAVVEMFKIEKGLLYFKGFEKFVLAFEHILEIIKFNLHFKYEYCCFLGLAEMFLVAARISFQMKASCWFLKEFLFLLLSCLQLIQ